VEKQAVLAFPAFHRSDENLSTGVAFSIANFIATNSRILFPLAGYPRKAANFRVAKFIVPPLLAFLWNFPKLLWYANYSLAINKLPSPQFPNADWHSDCLLVGRSSEAKQGQRRKKKARKKTKTGGAL